MSNQKKSAVLGMPFGTACNRLRKVVLFHILVKHDENVCHRCNQKIEDVSELSIEHIEPWENAGESAKGLFWDVNNIAFSHLHCNVGAASRPTQKYFTPESKLDAKRNRTAKWMRNNYSTEKRQEKFERTGY